MGYFAELAAELADAHTDDGPEHDRCAVCGEIAESIYTGDCENPACPRRAALAQVDPPAAPTSPATSPWYDAREMYCGNPYDAERRRRLAAERDVAYVARCAAYTRRLLARAARQDAAAVAARLAAATERRAA